MTDIALIVIAVYTYKISHTLIVIAQQMPLQ